MEYVKLGFIGAFPAFPMRCHPQADAGDREAVDEESGTQFGVGCGFSPAYQGFYHTRTGELNQLSSSVTR